MTENAAWRIIAVLSIVSAGAYVGNEAAVYFWDLSVYVTSLDSEFPYRFAEPYPFLYPPFAKQLFTSARSHLFELLSIAYVGAAVYFLSAVADLPIRRRFEWLLAITAMGGLGVVSLMSGNIGIGMNLIVLGLALQAASGKPAANSLLPVAIGFGALIKPQFILYIAILQALESRRTALVKMAAVGAVVAGVYLFSMWLMPFDWNEYVQGVLQRTVVEKDYAWGPAGFVKHFTDSESAALAAYFAGFITVWLLAYAAWRTSQRNGGTIPDLSFVCLAFVVLTFMNPRIPLYDMYAAAIAVAICCALVSGGSTRLPLVMAGVLAINLVPWWISEFTRTPSSYPWWLQDLHSVHMLGIFALLIALARTGMHQAPMTD